VCVRVYMYAVDHCQISCGSFDVFRINFYDILNDRSSTLEYFYVFLWCMIIAYYKS
jgi:hypothetical protein